MRLSCYIHRNPLRAGIVDRLVDFTWSSYKVYAYGEKAPSWLKTKPILSYFRGTEKNKAYRIKVQQYAKENAQRISKQKKEDRDLLVYLVRKNCVLTNEEIGHLFGMSYSAISHIISSMKTMLQQNPDLQNKYKHLYSLCKI